MWQLISGTADCMLHLLGWHTYSVRASCFRRRICRLSSLSLSRLISGKLSEIGAKFRCLCKKSGLLSKNMVSDFAPVVVAKYPQSSPKPQNSPK